MSIRSRLLGRAARSSNPAEPQSLLWDLGSTAPADIACNHIALTFLQLARTFSGALAESHQSSGYAQLLTPAVLACKPELAACAEPLLKELRDEGIKDPSSALLTDQGQRWLGQTISEFGKHSNPQRKLFAAAQQVLASTLQRHQPELPKHLTLLQAMMGLTDAEIGFVDLALTQEYACLDFDAFSFINKPQRVRAALAMLGLKNLKTQGGHTWLLHTRGKLVRSGLFDDLTAPHRDLNDLLRLSRLGQNLLAEPHETAEGIASAVLEPFLEPFLPSDLADATHQPLAWPHLALETQHLQSLLGHVMQEPQMGVNIMLHGGPGTGKTEFARQLCQQLNAQYGSAAYCVATKDDDGDVADRSARLANLQLCQQLAGSAPAVLVLDEAEDIFQSDYNNPFAGLFGKSEGQTESKSWTNNLLETNQHPVIWISNRISHLDPAYLRRFAYVLEFRNPPRSQRLAIAQQHLAPVGASAALLERLSYNSALPPPCWPAAHALSA
jgi:hypothetical protein